MRSLHGLHALTQRSGAGHTDADDAIPTPRTDHALQARAAASAQRYQDERQRFEALRGGQLPLSLELWTDRRCVQLPAPSCALAEAWLDRFAVHRAGGPHPGPIALDPAGRRLPLELAQRLALEYGKDHAIAADQAGFRDEQWAQYGARTGPRLDDAFERRIFRLTAGRAFYSLTRRLSLREAPFVAVPTDWFVALARFFAQPDAPVPGPVPAAALACEGRRLPPGKINYRYFRPIEAAQLAIFFGAAPDPNATLLPVAPLGLRSIPLEVLQQFSAPSLETRAGWPPPRHRRRHRALIGIAEAE